MTPFGQKLRSLRRDHHVNQTVLADALGVSAAYLSALEHGRRGKPSRELVHHICSYFGLIWEEADKLQHLADRSHPKITIDTGGLHPLATECAHLLSQDIAKKTEAELAVLKTLLLQQHGQNK